MVSNRLALNSDKTHFMVMTSKINHQKYDNFGIVLETGTESIYPSETERLLGAQISNDFSWNQHLNLHEKSVRNILNSKISALQKICLSADFKTRKMLANGLVLSNLVYVIQLYGSASEYLIKSLQVQQNRAARLVTKLEYGTRTKVLLNQVGWLSVRQLFVYHSLLLVYKVKQNGKPSYLNERLSTDFKYRTRQAASNSLVVMDTPRSEVGRTSFVNTSRRLWNSLPAELKKTSQQSSFKIRLRDWILKNIDI